MAKRKSAQQESSTVNKSQAIRTYLEEHPGEGPTSVAKTLTAQTGVTIKAGYVSAIKNKMKPKRGRGRGTKKTALAPEDRVLANLLQAKRFAEQMGGVSKAKGALDRLSKLVD